MMNCFVTDDFTSRLFVFEIKQVLKWVCLGNTLKIDQLYHFILEVFLILKAKIQTYSEKSPYIR